MNGIQSAKAVIGSCCFVLASCLSSSIWCCASPAAEPSDEKIEIGKAIITMHVEGELPYSLRLKAKEWVKNSAKAVASYYGNFPVDNCVVVLHARDGHGFGLGTADLQDKQARIDLPLGCQTSDRELHDDWVLPHEMVHLAFPLVLRRDRWLVEGMATYVEPFARLQLGFMTAKDVWGDLFKNCPAGQARDRTDTLSQSRRIKRIYWGGAAFCLLADLELRKKSQNRFGLQDGLAAIARAGANIKSDMTARQALGIADRSLGVDTLVKLYDRMSRSSTPVDLNKTFTLLGVKADAAGITFDDKAPLAMLRKSIESGKSN